MYIACACFSRWICSRPFIPGNRAPTLRLSHRSLRVFIQLTQRTGSLPPRACIDVSFRSPQHTPPPAATLRSTPENVRHAARHDADSATSGQCVWYSPLLGPGYTSVHIGMLRYTSAYFGILRYTSVYFDILRYTSVYSGILRYTSEYSGILRYTSVYFDMLRYTSLYFGILCC